MKIYDIAQPVFECTVFPGDPQPDRIVEMKIADGDICNLTSLRMCSHNGTHVDAPCHFIDGAKGMDEVSLYKFIGPAYVEKHDGDVTAEDAKGMLERAAACAEAKATSGADSIYAGAEKRILIGGKATVTLEAAKVFAEAGVDVVGNESQTVGPEDAPKDVHMVLLGAEVVLLEGIRLAEVPEGVYLLNAAPLNLTKSDGSPCRAVLLDI